MEEKTRLIGFRVSPADMAKLERLRQRSRRGSIQNVLEALVAMADENAPEWNIVLLEPKPSNGDSPTR